MGHQLLLMGCYGVYVSLSMGNLHRGETVINHNFNGGFPFKTEVWWVPVALEVSGSCWMTLFEVTTSVIVLCEQTLSWPEKYQ